MTLLRTYRRCRPGGNMPFPLLETERLVVACAALWGRKGDRRARRRPPHCCKHRPHSASVQCRGRREFIGAVNQRDSEVCFVIMCGERLIGACGLDPHEDGPELGYWLGHLIGAAALLRKPRARLSITLSAISNMKRSGPVHASTIRRRAACWKSAPSNGSVCGSPASAPSIRLRRSIASASIAGCGRRLRRGGRPGRWRNLLAAGG